MLILAIALSVVSLVVSGVSLYLVHKASKKLQIHKSVPCHKCNRSVPVYVGEVDGPKECNSCQARRR